MAKEMGKADGGNAIRSAGDWQMRTWIFDKRLGVQSLDNFWARMPLCRWQLAINWTFTRTILLPNHQAKRTESNCLAITWEN